MGAEMLTEAYLKKQLSFIDSDRYCRSLIESHLEAYRKLEAITVLCVEGVEFMTRTELSEAILNEIYQTRRYK